MVSGTYNLPTSIPTSSRPPSSSTTYGPNLNWTLAYPPPWPMDRFPYLAIDYRSRYSYCDHRPLTIDTARHQIYHLAEPAVTPGGVTSVIIIYYLSLWLTNLSNVTNARHISFDSIPPHRTFRPIHLITGPLPRHLLPLPF